MNKRFKNAGIALLLMSISYSVTAQNRYTDMEVVGISPSGTIKNGATLPLIFKMTNHGPDEEIDGDTLFYRLYQVEADDVKDIYTGPIVSSRPRLVGQSSTYRDNYVINSFNFPDLKEPITVDFCFEISTKAFLTNGDSMILSRQDTNSANNLNCTKVTIMPRTTHIPEKDRIALGFEIYPNPADKVILLRMKKDAVASALKVTISDLSGRTLIIYQFKEQEVHDGTLSLKVDQLPVGLFIVHMQSETASVSKRLTIIK